VVNKKAEIIRVYVPPDANCLLSVADHCLRSRDYVNVIGAGVHTIFGYPEAAIMPFYDALLRHPALRHVLVRHEAKDVQAGPAPPLEDPSPSPSLGRTEAITDKTLTLAAALLAGSRRPLILAGHGVLTARAHTPLRRLAERWRAPVSTTLLGLGSSLRTIP
jgi:thiamine pyrophosphate-dependent acetolactate synthase large subunit-like protein